MLRLVLVPLVSLFVLVVTGAALPAAEPAAGPDVRTAESADWYRHDGKEKQFTEFWTGIVQSDNGWIVYVSYLRTNMGLISGNVGVAISVTAPDGTVTREKIRHDAAEYREDRGKGTIDIDVQGMRFDPKGHTLHVDLETIDLDVTLVPWTDGFKFGDGRKVVDEAHDTFMKYAFLIPRADARGELRVGDQTIRLEGAGYLDHMITNRSLTLWSRRWYVTHAFAPDLTVLFMEGHPFEGFEHLHGRLGWFTVVDRNGVRFATDQPQLRFRKTEGPREGCTWPTQFVLDAAAGKDAVRMAYRTTSLHDPYVVLDQLSAVIRRLVAAVLGNPVFFRFTDEYEMKLTLDGRTRRIKGRGLHQVVCMRPDAP